MTLSSKARTGVVTLGVVVVWALMMVAAAHQPGYDWTRDTISSLASRGAEDGWIGMLCIGSAGVLTISSAWILAPTSRPGALALLAAGIALVVLSVARIQCIHGAAMCQMLPKAPDWMGPTHFVAVAVYEICFVTAIGSCAIALWHRGVRLAPFIALLAMAASLLLFWHPLGLGGQQRAWLGVHSLVLIGLTLLPTPEGAEQAKTRARTPVTARRIGVELTDLPSRG